MRYQSIIVIIMISIAVLLMPLSAAEKVVAYSRVKSEVSTEGFWSWQDYPLYVPDVKPIALRVFTNVEFVNSSYRPVTVTVDVPDGEFSKILARIDVKLESVIPGRPAVNYDRALWIFVNGAPLVIGTTAQRFNYTVITDVTYAYPLLVGGSKNFSVILPNWVVTRLGLTGYFVMNLTLFYYPGETLNVPDMIIPLWTKTAGNLARAVLTVKRPNATQIIKIEKPILRAYLLLFLEGMAYDEFWWDNIPKFRFVKIFSDDKLIAITQPYHHIFTGGINPLLWRPLPAIDTYAFRPFIIDVTPYLPYLVGSHNLTITIDGLLNRWSVFGALLLYSAPEPVTYEKVRDETTIRVFNTTSTVKNITYYQAFGEFTVKAATIIHTAGKTYLAMTNYNGSMSAFQRYNDVWDNVTVVERWKWSSNMIDLESNETIISIDKDWYGPLIVRYAFIAKPEGDISKATPQNPVPANFTLVSSVYQRLKVLERYVFPDNKISIEEDERVHAYSTIDGRLNFIGPTAAIITAITDTLSHTSKDVKGVENKNGIELSRFNRFTIIHGTWPKIKIIYESIKRT